MAAKQFTLETRDCYNYGIWVVDIIKDNVIELPQSTACDLLNKLTKENEELNSIKKFADRNGICIFNIDEAFRRCWQDNAKLVKENNQLKSTINTLTHDNTKMKKVLNTTKKENEHIKNTIQEAYHNERTQLGQSVLKQLLNNIGEIQ